MNAPPHPLPPFLLGQQLRELIGVDDLDDRRIHVCGGVRETKSERPQPKQAERDPWQPVERPAVRTRVASREAPKRVALVCDAGLGKTTNLEWLAAAVAGHPGSRQIPLLLRLDAPHDLDLLAKEHANPDALLDWLAALVKKAAGGQTNRHRLALDRMQSSGRITLLIDGLDHALSRQDVPRMLWDLLHSVQWRRCPVWVAGRPYAFDGAWELFSSPEWRFFRVEPLAEREIRFYLTRQGGGDWYDEIATDGRTLLAVPRLLRLTAGILEGAVRAAAGPEEQRLQVRRLNLHTAADVYNLAYFTAGECLDGGHRLPGRGAAADRRGLIASGLVGDAASIGLLPGVQPTPQNYRQRINRTAALLGAIAFEMFATNAEAARPEPNTVGVPEEQLEAFHAAVQKRLLAAGQRAELDFDKDLNLLTRMNNDGVDFLLFRELGQKGLVWHDRTVQAFFAAYWAMKYSSPNDRELMRRWVVDAAGKRLGGYDDFWTFAATSPDALVDRVRWLEVFAPCYAPPQQVTGSADGVQWHRRMIYHSFPRMQSRSAATIAGWRASFHALEKGADKEQRLHQEIVGGFRPVREGVCPYGADPLGGTPGIERPVAEFRLHQWPVTNEMYEAFDPAHRNSRWYGPEKHPLTQESEGGDNRCPVVNVTWYDAWCFARWTGFHLPGELQWEYACRGGASFPESFHFGNSLSSLQANFNGNYPDGDAQKGPYRKCTSPVGSYPANGFGLYDMHGNVWEWCEDRWEPAASARVLRGGSWFNLGWLCRSAYRFGSGPDNRYNYYGFRLAAVPASLEPSAASKEAERRERSQP